MNEITIYITDNTEKSQEIAPNLRLVLCAKARHANTFLSRLRGLIGRPALKSNQGLLLTPCAQVHTLGMRYSLDIVFLSKTGQVLKCTPYLKPNRFSAASKAYHALELVAGDIQTHNIQVGDQLNWTENI